MKIRILSIIHLLLITSIYSTLINANSSTKNDKTKRGITYIYHQDFEGDFPGDMTVIDIDKQIPNNKVSEFGKSWSKKIIKDNYMAAVTSWFTTTGTANDWMITPAIDLTTDNKLIWSATSLHKDYKDSYKVWISTTAPDAANFDPSKFTLLKDVSKEESTLTTHIIYLQNHGYKNQKVWIAFQLISDNCYVLGIDNIIVGQYNGVDCENITIPSNKTININKDITINASIRNTLMESITSVEMKWYIEGSSEIHTQTFDGFNLKYMESKSLSFDDKFTGNENGEKKVIVEITKVNGRSDIDENKSNNKQSFYIETIANPVPQKILLEKITSAKDWVSPDNDLIAEELIGNNNNLILTCAHVDDNMEISETKALYLVLNRRLSGCMINRIPFNRNVSGGLKNIWNTAINKITSEMPTSVSIDVEANYNYSNKEVTANITTNFNNEKNGDFRLNLYIVENNVTGIGEGWDQWNNYENPNLHPNHPLNGKGNPIIGYVHNHVIRKMVGGIWGTKDIIPKTAHGKYYHQYKTKISDEWNPENIKVIAIISEYGESTFSKQIFNSCEKKLIPPNIVSESIELYNGDDKIDITKDIVIKGKTTDNELTYKFKVKNTSNYNVDIKLVNKVRLIPDYHDYYFFWKECYSANATESNIMPIYAGTTHNDEISLHLKPNGKKGGAASIIELVNSNNPEDKIRLNIGFDIKVPPIKESLELYSNENKIDISKPIIIDGKTTDNELTYKFKVKNISDYNIDVKLITQSISSIDDHSFFFCWKNSYNPETTESNTMSVPAKTTHSNGISLHLNSNGKKGKSKYKIQLINSNNPEDKIDFEVVFNVIEIPPIKESIELYNNENKIDISKPIIIDGKTNDNELTYKFKVKNISDYNIDVKLIAQNISSIDNHSFFFCWKDSYNPKTTESKTMSIPAKTIHNDDISLHLNSNSKKGKSKYKIQLINSNNPEDKISFEVVFNVIEIPPIKESIELYNNENKINISKPIIIDGKTTDNELIYKLWVKNISDYNIDVKLIAKDISTIEDHSFFFCWKDYYNPKTTESNTMSIPAKTTYQDNISFHLNPNGKKGNSLYKIILVNSNSPDDKIDFEVIFNVDPYINNIYTSNQNDIVIYPNPFKDFLIIENKHDYLVGNDIMILIYSTEGNLVERFKLNSSTNKKINCSNLSSGIYLYKIVYSDKVFSGKIIKL
jgi:ribosomal protein S16